jgi:small ligand-binding sensory domain FIST
VPSRHGGGADVAFVFVTPCYADHLTDVAELIQIHGHVKRVVGCSTTGLIANGYEHEGVSGLSMLFLRLPQTTIEIDFIEGDEMGFDPDDDRDPVPSIVLLHPMRLNAPAWLAQWNCAFPAVACIGAMASGKWESEGVFLFNEKGVLPEGVAGIVVKLYGGVRIENVLSQGCRPIGKPLTITGAHDNVLTSLGGRSARAVLFEAVQELRSKGTEIAPGMIHAGLAVSEFVDNYGRGDFIVRNIIGEDPLKGHVQLGALPHLGQTFQFQLRDSEAADEELRQQVKWIQSLVPESPRAILLFTCGGRGQSFFGIPHHDAGLFLDAFPSVSMAGFFGMGELGQVGLSNFLHGYTASAAIFYDA